MEIPILFDILIIFTLSIVVVLIFSRLKIPSLVGFLLTGIIAGPYGFKLVNDIKGVEILAEIGVILLLFSIGIEFSLKSLMKIKKAVFLGGGLQVSLSILVVSLLLFYFGSPLNQAIFIGFVISISSTAIILKLLQDKGEIESQHGRNSLAISIFQDISGVPMILLIPLLAGSAQNTFTDFMLTALKALIVLILSYFLARFLIPKLLYQVTKTRSNELFILTIITICFFVTTLTNYAGLSLAFGAFLAGLIISESEYSAQAIGKILPFRDIFLGLFFVSIGMLLNLSFVLEKPLIIIALAISVILIKAIIMGFASFISGYPLRTSLVTSLLLAQIGEFSFIIASLGLKERLISEDIYQLILAVAIISMGVTPFIFKVTPALGDILLRLPIPAIIKRGLNPVPETKPENIQNHLIIVGYGTNGQNVARAARYAGIPYIIIEMNPQTVRELFAKNEWVIFGDASQAEVLKYAHINTAMVLVVAVPDSANALRITHQCHHLNPACHIIVRAKYMTDVPEFNNLGAHEVIPAEFETSIEIFSRVLRKFLVPRNEIEKLVTNVRAKGYEMLRSFSLPEIDSFKCTYSDMEIHSFKVTTESKLKGKKISDIQSETEKNIKVLAIKRKDDIKSCIDNDLELEQEDIIILLGYPDDIRLMLQGIE